MLLRLQDMSEKEFQLMHAAMLRLLDEYGVLFEMDSARELLAKAGNRIDSDGRTHLKPKFVESMLAKVPKKGFRTCGRDESKEELVAVDSLSCRPSTGTPFILDYKTRRRRPATMEDAKNMVLLTDALECYHMVNPVVSPPEAPGSKGNLTLFLTAHRYSLKPSEICVMTALEVNAIARMGAAIRGSAQKLRDKPLTIIDVAMITPLRCTQEQTEALLECAKWGLPVEVLTSPAMGMTGPITISGSSVLALAETVAALCLTYLAAPGLGIMSAARVTPVDMRTTALNFGAPELGMASVVMSDLCAHYHIPTNLYGLGSVAKTAGDQAIMEKSFSGLLLGLGHPRTITGGGHLDNSLVTSPEQLVMDHEAARFIERIRRPIEITEEALGIDAVIAGSASGSLLTEEHTCKYLRLNELMRCGLNQWCSFQEWEEKGSPSLLDRAHQKVEEILATHTVAPFERTLERELAKIMDSVVD